MLQKYNDTCALPGHTMVRLGGIGEAKEPMKQSATCCRNKAERTENMTQVICVFGDTEFVASELSTKLSEGWQIISIETNVYESYGQVKRDTTCYLKSQ